MEMKQESQHLLNTLSILIDTPIQPHRSNSPHSTTPNNNHSNHQILSNPIQNPFINQQEYIPRESIFTDPNACCLCGDLNQTLPLSSLKQRLVRLLKRLYPRIQFLNGTRVCAKDLHGVLHSRVEDLLIQDSIAYAQLQVKYIIILTIKHKQLY